MSTAFLRRAFAGLPAATVVARFVLMRSTSPEPGLPRKEQSTMQRTDMRKYAEEALQQVPEEHRRRGLPAERSRAPAATMSIARALSLINTAPSS
jgi:hypothetical protein